MLDLGLVVVAYTLAAVWLWHDRPCASSLAAALFVGGVTSQFGYMGGPGRPGPQRHPRCGHLGPGVIVAIYALGAWLTLGRRGAADLPTRQLRHPSPGV